MSWLASYIDDRASQVVEDLLDYYGTAIEDRTERVEWIEDLIAVATRYPEAFARQLAERLREKLPDLRREAGQCPICGGELVERRAGQRHPYGATVAYESWTVTVCPVHGEVQ